MGPLFVKPGIHVLRVYSAQHLFSEILVIPSFKEQKTLVETPVNSMLIQRRYNLGSALYTLDLSWKIIDAEDQSDITALSRAEMIDNSGKISRIEENPLSIDTNSELTLRFRADGYQSASIEIQPDTSTKTVEITILLFPKKIDSF